MQVDADRAVGERELTGAGLQHHRPVVHEVAIAGGLEGGDGPDEVAAGDEDVDVDGAAQTGVVVQRRSPGRRP